MPEHLVADEKITWQDGQEVLLAAAAGGGCFLGVSLVTDIQPHLDALSVESWRAI